MGYSVPQPQYGLLKGLPVADPVGSALGAYTTIAQQRRQQQLANLQQRLGALQAQRYQQQIGAFPAEEQLKQQTAQADITQKKVATATTRRNYLQNQYSILAQLSQDQKPEFYQKIRAEALSLGEEPSKLPAVYNKQIETVSQDAFKNNPRSIQQLKNQNTLHLQQLKNTGALEVAQARIAGRAPKEGAFQQAQAKQLSGDVATINTAADEAQTKAKPLWQEVGGLIDKVVTGPGIGKIDWRSSDAQRLLQLITQAQGEYVKTFHLGRMTQYEFKLLQRAVGTPTMYRSVLKKIVNDHLRQAQEAISHQKYANDYIKKGGRNPIELSSSWVKELGNRRQADLEYTAKQHGLTVAQVKKQLGRI